MSETPSGNPLEQTIDHSRPTDAATLVPQALGYVLYERVGVGGMGEVYRCGDDALHRDLAIKVIKRELHGDADAEERFLREARLTGSLQHPGTVPIHQLGRLADGRPYYTMKLIRGRTFADMLRDEAQGPERLPRLLAVVEKVCQAVAYAHSRGVIHRDLKPANVMVGEFGEVQVMDWGLARELQVGVPAKANERAAAEATTDWVEVAAGLSKAGAALGTPAYMSPEQAAGDWAIVDERTDVFALGAMLCVILTGQPPYEGASGEEVLRRARRGDLAEARSRLERCGAEAALTALCQECLTPEREGRPRNAEAVAQRLAAYQAAVQERLRRAELERAAAQVKAHEERKRRRLILTLALLVLAVGGEAWWLQRQQALRRAEIAQSQVHRRASVEGALKQVRQLQRDGRLPEARAVLNQVEHQENEVGLDDVRGSIVRARGSLDLITQLDTIRLNRTICGTLETGHAEAARKYAEAFRKAGFTLEQDGEGWVNKIRDSAIREHLIVALDDWAMATRDRDLQARLLKVARLADPDPEWHDRFPDPAVWENRQALETLSREAMNANLSPHLSAVLGWLINRAGANPEPLLYTAQQKHPNDFWINYMLAHVLLDRNKPAEAMGFWRAALAIRPESALVLNNIGVTLRQLGQLEVATSYFRQAMDRDPSLPLPHGNLALILLGKDQLEQARKEFDIASGLDDKLAHAHYGQALVFLRQGHFAQACSALRRARELLPAKDPLRSPIQNGLSSTERLLALNKRLPAILSGQASPANPGETIALASLCLQPYKKHYAVSVRLYADAFAAAPKLAADLNQQHRYNASCAAALAAAGQGQDAHSLPDKVAVMFRSWALGWLRDDLSAYATLAERKNPQANRFVQQQLTHWRRDPDLASVREPQALDRLPAHERAAWHALWHNVDELTK